jgi:protein-export membrane protein SecD
MRRINPDGGRPIVVSASGEDRILVEARGETDYTRLREVIGPTGLLTFHMVREVDPAEAAAGRLPPGTMLALPYGGGSASSEVVDRRPRFSGERIARAFPTADAQTGEMVLSFQLDAEGTRIFCRITREHVGERFAVLLDGKVVTAPRVNEPICGGSGQISGNFTAQSAGQLAALLRAGALPAPLVVVEEGVRRPPPRQP